MLEADAASRRRMKAVGAAVGVLLGGFAVSGLVQRYLPDWNAAATTATPAPTGAQLAAFRAEAQRLRAARKQLAAHARRGEWREAAAGAGRALGEKDHASLRFLRGEALLRAGDPSGATLLSDLLLDTEDIPRAQKLLLRGDLPGYRVLCAGAIRRTDPERSDALTANNTAWLCALGPDALEDFGPAVVLAQSAVERATPEERFTYLNTLGAVLYRAGRDREAVERLMEAERLKPDPFNWPFLAMAHARLGDGATARTYRARLRKELDATYATPRRQESRQELLLFWRETEAAVGGG
jgi:tetratricopeptide (TPR) repeat protein